MHNHAGFKETEGHWLKRASWTLASGLQVAVFVDFSNIAFAVDEFGHPFLELYLPREGELRGDKKILREDGQIPLKRPVLREHGTFLGYIVDLPDPPLD